MSSSSISNLILVAAVLGIGWLIITKGKTDSSPRGGGDTTAAGTAAAAAAGDCSSTIYPKTGRTLDMPGKFGTRNYASGKPSTITWESEVDVDSTWKNYELTTYFMTPTGSGGGIHKMYGPKHQGKNGPWYTLSLSLNGNAGCGAELQHPSNNPSVKCTGGTKTNFGSLLGKKVGLKSVIWTDAAGDVTLEGYVDAGTGKWEKKSSMKNPNGWRFKPQTPQNLLFRSDGLKDLKVYCSTAQEIIPPTGETAQAKYASYLAMRRQQQE